MTSMVTVHGTEPDERTSQRSRGLIYAVVGLVAGLGLGALFTGTGSGPGGDLSPDSTAIGPPDGTLSTTTLPSTTTRPTPVRLATLVPGMLDVLVASAVDGSGMSVVTVWTPSGRVPTVEPLPWGGLVADASRSWLAFGGPNRWVVGETLWVGNPAHMEPVSSALVSAPVWHVRLPGELAWIEDTAAGRVLMTARFVAGRDAIPREVAPVGDGIRVVGWTDGGYLTTRFEDDAGHLQLRDLQGQVQTEIEISKFAVSVGATLVAAVDPEGNHLLLDHGLATVGAAPWDADCPRVVWSPSGLAVMLLCGLGNSSRIEYWQDARVDTTPTFTHAGKTYTDLGFTSNGLPYGVWNDSLRPASTVFFHHPIDGTTYEVSHPGRVQWLVSVQG